jgi:hypothetical protein
VGAWGWSTTSFKVGRAAEEDDGEVEDVFACVDGDLVSNED